MKTFSPVSHRLSVLASGLGLLLLVLLAPAGRAQEDPSTTVDDQANDAPAGLAGNTARLTFEGVPSSSVSFTRMPSGPVFDLAVMARVLNLDLIVGPRDQSYRLKLKGEEVLVGADKPIAVVTPSDAGSRPESITLSQTPIQKAYGLQVPLDFLQIVLGEELRFDFDWDDEQQILQIRRHEARDLEASILVIHQVATTVEIRFSEPPRYRMERSEGKVEIVLAGDRIGPVDIPRHNSPLVTNLEVLNDRLRIALAANADVAEPRMSGPRRLIIEVYKSTGRADAADTPESPRRVTSRVTKSRTAGIRTIVIDPGHGGEATGAVGPNGTTEKELALTVSRSLKNLLRRRLGVHVVMTRERDENLPHEARTAIANQNKADLFISIHFNSYYGRSAMGAETYFLSRDASDKVAADIAEQENQSLGGASPESDLQLILWDLAQTYHLSESQRFASLVQEELNLSLGLRNRGVKQAPFRVLMGAAMPAVLVELGFISNPREEERLNSPAHQNKLVNSLFRAIQRFKRQIESPDQPPLQPSSPAPGDSTTTPPNRESRR